MEVFQKMRLLHIKVDTAGDGWNPPSVVSLRTFVSEQNPKHLSTNVFITEPRGLLPLPW